MAATVNPSIEALRRADRLVMTLRHRGPAAPPCWIRWRAWALPLLLMVWMLGACASGPTLVNHAFGFNVELDSPGHQVLAYRYGAGSVSTTSSDTSIRQFGQSRQGTNVNGPMPLGDTLHVRWRVNSTGQTHEETVDLRPLLPRDMTRQRIHFVVAGPQLYVYLIDPVPRPPDWPVVGPRKFHNEKIRQIHPR